MYLWFDTKLKQLKWLQIEVTFLSALNHKMRMLFRRTCMTGIEDMVISFHIIGKTEIIFTQSEAI